MRILYHHRTRLEDAQGVHIQEMVRAFRELGHEVEVVSLVDASAPAAPSAASSFSRATQDVPDWLYETMSLGYNLYGYRRLARAIRRLRPHFIYERYALNTVCGVWASRRFALPLLLEVNAPLYREQNALGRLALRKIARYTERWICANSTRTIVVTGVLRDILASEGVPANHMTVMPNGIDLADFNPQLSGAQVRARYDLDNRTVVGVVGWFRKWHGIEMLVQAMHEHGLLTDNVRLLLVGDGPAYADVLSYARAHDLTRFVVCTGAVAREEVAAHVAAMDVTVQPSATDYACPMKLIEYMAMGRCVVAPDQPNIREIVGNGDTAVLFTPGDQAGLAAALARVVADAPTRTALGRRAYEDVIARGRLWRCNAERVIELALAVQHSGRQPVPSVAEPQAGPLREA